MDCGEVYVACKGGLGGVGRVVTLSARIMDSDAFRMRAAAIADDRKISSRAPS
jgi:hypothetical protein